jgi:hypothetical protein
MIMHTETPSRQADGQGTMRSRVVSWFGDLVGRPIGLLRIGAYLRVGLKLLEGSVDATTQGWSQGGPAQFKPR